MMAVGVTYDEFWHGDPEIVTFAIEAARAKAKSQAIEADILAWNTGRYVMLAVSTVLSHAFSKSSSAKYPKEPMLALELDDELKRQKEERELRLAHENFLALARAMEARNSK